MLRQAPARDQAPVEPLESRRLLAADTFTPVPFGGPAVFAADGASVQWHPDGTIAVHGTPGHDQIGVRVYYDPVGPWSLHVEINRTQFRLTPAVDPGSFTRINVDAGAGDDRVGAGALFHYVRPSDGNVPQYADALRLVDFPVVLAGGDGNDRFDVAGRYVTLLGGDGDDYLESEHDDPTLYPTDPADHTLDGGAGNDAYYSFYPAPAVPGEPSPAQLVPAYWREIGPDGAIAGITDDDTLFVRGTAADDVITLRRPEGRFIENPPVTVAVNGVATVLDYVNPRLSPQRIAIDTAGGADAIYVDDHQPRPLPVYVNGSALAPGEIPAIPADLPAPTIQPRPKYGWQFSPPAPAAPTPDPAAPIPADQGPENSQPPARVSNLPAPPPPPPPRIIRHPGKPITLARKASIQWRPDGTLVIRGTAGHDHIHVRRDNRARLLVTVNRASHVFHAGAPIRHIEVDARAGHDTVVLGRANAAATHLTSALALPATVTGGRGQDTLLAGPRATFPDRRPGPDAIVRVTRPTPARS